MAAEKGPNCAWEGVRTATDQVPIRDIMSTRSDTKLVSPLPKLLPGYYGVCWWPWQPPCSAISGAPRGRALRPTALTGIGANAGTSPTSERRRQLLSIFNL